MKLKTQVFTKGKLIKTIILQLENMRTLPYFAKMERSFSQELLQIARKNMELSVYQAVTTVFVKQFESTSRLGTQQSQQFNRLETVFKKTVML